LNGRFCLSDDSHGIDQVASNYHLVLNFMESVGISTLHYLELSTDPDVSEVLDDRFPWLEIRSMSLSEVKQLPFWQTE
jgi:histidinol-phosphatase (PHP family)